MTAIPVDSAVYRSAGLNGAGPCGQGVLDVGGPSAQGMLDSAGPCPKSVRSYYLAYTNARVSKHAIIICGYLAGPWAEGVLDALKRQRAGANIPHGFKNGKGREKTVRKEND